MGVVVEENFGYLLDPGLNFSWALQENHAGLQQKKKELEFKNTV